MRSALWWASQHLQHHRCADGEDDPHAPRDRIQNAPIGWFHRNVYQEPLWDYVREWLRFPELVWIHRHEAVPLVAINLICFAAGGFPGWVWGANVSTVLLCHATFALNSVTHLPALGSRRYDTPDDSTNFLPVALATFGEGWHNNHHRSPARARLGETAGELDVSWWGLLAFDRLGLVSDLIG